MTEIIAGPGGTGLNPDRLYTADEVVELFGYSGPRAKDLIYQIPADDLIRTRLGPKGGTVRFRGRDLLAYMDARRDDG